MRDDIRMVEMHLDKPHSMTQTCAKIDEHIRNTNEMCLVFRSANLATNLSLEHCSGLI